MTQHEIPSDPVVCATLQRIGAATARQLVSALVEAQYDSRDSQRAIQRCLDRGKIKLGAGLRLQLTDAGEAVAA